jgi:hypothetical protein
LSDASFGRVPIATNNKSSASSMENNYYFYYHLNLIPSLICHIHNN